MLQAVQSTAEFSKSFTDQAYLIANVVEILLPLALDRSDHRLSELSAVGRCGFLGHVLAFSEMV